MRILIFSDTHFTNYFEKKRYFFLQSLINRVDLVIINGDLWDNHLISIDQFVNSKWNKLFPLLKKKNTIYLYGNHDLKKDSFNKEHLFSVTQKYRHVMTAGNKRLVIEHGDKLCFIPDTDSKLKLKIMYVLESTAVRIFGNKIHTLLFQKKLNERIKRQLPALLKSNEIYVCGHTHVSEFDLKNQFINDGFIRNGLAQYVIVDNDSIQLKVERYSSNGILP